MRKLLNKLPKVSLAMLCGLACFAIAFTACDSGSSSSTIAGDNKITAATFDDLEACTEALEGESAYVKDEKAMYTCEGGKWTVCTDCDTAGAPSKAGEFSASKGKSSSSKKKSDYVCEIYSLSDAQKCECNEEREDSLAYNYDSSVELVCIFDEYLNKWGWVENKKDDDSGDEGEDLSSASKGKSSSSKAKSSASKGKAETSSSAKSESTEPGKSSAKETSSSSKANASDDDDNSEIVLGGKCVEGDVEAVVENGVRTVYACADPEKGWEIYVSKTKSSSSSVVRSSSSAHYAALVDDPLSIKNHGEFEDPRDHEKYATIEISNTCGDDSLHITYTVMAQNLKYYEKMTPGAEEQDDDEHVERYCYNDSVEYCNDWWSALYQWAEAMALPYKCNHEPCDNLIDPDGDGFHQGICPDGWHILNWREAKAAEFNEKCRTNGYTMMSARTFLVGKGTNYSGFSAIAAGRRVSPEDYVYEGKWFDQLRRESTVWFSLEEKDEKYINDAIGYHFGEYANYWHTEKTEGNMVRCVKDY